MCDARSVDAGRECPTRTTRKWSLRPGAAGPLRPTVAPVRRGVSEQEAGARSAAEASGFVLSGTKFHRPTPGLVPHAGLVSRLVRPDAHLIVAAAGAGFGKTTLLAELATLDPRPVAWLSIDDADNDPATLLTYVAAALDDVEPIDPQVLH